MVDLVLGYSLLWFKISVLSTYLENRTDHSHFNYDKAFHELHMKHCLEKMSQLKPDSCFEYGKFPAKNKTRYTLSVVTEAGVFVIAVL